MSSRQPPKPPKDDKSDFNKGYNPPKYEQERPTPPATPPPKKSGK